MEIKKIENGWEYAGITFRLKKDALKVRNADKSETGANLDLGNGKMETIYDSDKKETSFGNAFTKFMVESKSADSIENIAKKIGVSRPTLYHWIKGERMPSPEKAQSIKKVFDWTDQQLIQAFKTNNENHMAKAIGVKIELVHKYLHKSA